MQLGLYEQLINKVISLKLNTLDIDKFYIQKTKIDKVEASKVLSQYLFNVIQIALNQIKGDDSIEKQIELSNKIILLFVRESNKNEFNNTMSYVFLGAGDITEHYGSKPMNIKWKLREPIPPYLLKASEKMAVG